MCEIYFINFDKALRLLFKVCGWYGLAFMESINLALAIDGAELEIIHTLMPASKSQISMEFIL